MGKHDVIKERVKARGGEAIAAMIRTKCNGSVRPEGKHFLWFSTGRRPEVRPSAHANIREGWFTDFGNDEDKGDCLKLACIFNGWDEKKDFPLALKYCADILGIPHTIGREEPDGPLVLTMPASLDEFCQRYGLCWKYFKEAGIEQKDWYFPQVKSRSRALQYPYRKLSGEIVFKYKSLGRGPDGKREQSIQAGAEIATAVFGEIRKGEPLVVTAGEEKKLAANMAGLATICLPNGEKAPTDAQLDLIAAGAPSRVIVAYDADDAGRRASHKACNRLLPLFSDVSAVEWEEGTPWGFDLNDYLKVNGPDKLKFFLENCPAADFWSEEEGHAEGRALSVEQKIVSGIINNAEFAHVAIGKMEPESFADVRCAALFVALRSIYLRDGDVSGPQLQEHMEFNGLYNKPVTRDFVTEVVAESVGDMGRLTGFMAETVNQHAERRLKASMSDIFKAAQSGNVHDATTLMRRTAEECGEIMRTGFAPPVPIIEEPTTFPSLDLENLLPKWAVQFMAGCCQELHVHPNMMLIPLLSSLSAACAQGYAVQVTRSWMVYPNIYGLIVADSGEGKDAVLKACYKPIKIHAAEVVALHKKKAKEVKAKAGAAKAILQGQEVKAKRMQGLDAELDLIRSEMSKQMEIIDSAKAQLRPPKIRVDDATPEALAVDMRDNGPIAFFAVEGDGLFGSISRYNETGGSSANMMPILAGHDGGEFTISRRAPGGDESDKNITVACANITVCVCLQREFFQTLLENRAFIYRGMFNRFLWCFSPDLKGTRVFDDVQMTREIADNYQRNMLNILKSQSSPHPMFSPEGFNPCVLEMEPDARQMAVSWQNKMEKTLGKNRENEQFAALVAKANTNIVKIATCLHLADHSETIMGNKPGPVTKSAVERAIKIVEFLFEHSKTGLRRAGLTGGRREKDAEVVRNWFVRYGEGRRMTIQEIRQRCTQIAEDRKVMLEGVLNMLCDKRWLSVEPAQKPENGPGRPREIRYYMPESVRRHYLKSEKAT